MRDIFELNADDRRCLMHALPGPQIEWNTMPPPVVNKQLNCSERLSIRLIAYGFFFTVAGHFLTFDPTTPILAAHRILLDLFRIEFPHSMKHINLTVSHFISLEADRRFHCDKA
jgi:hypothetical protein